MGGSVSSLPRSAFAECQRSFVRLAAGTLFVPQLEEEIIPRLIICKECRTVEEIPLFRGTPEEEAKDPLIDQVVGRHLQKHAMTLVNQQNLGEGFTSIKLATIDDKVWHDPAVRLEVLANMKNQWTGFEPEYYAIKNTYQEDAMKCFNRHGRPDGECIDWHEDTKRLTPENWTKAHVYLCDFCPIASTVMVAQRKAKGYYNKSQGEVD